MSACMTTLAVKSLPLKTATCPLCTKSKKSLSCCAKRAAWFGKCGNDGDPNIEHTWNEGIEACYGILPQLLYVLYLCGRAFLPAQARHIPMQCNSSRLYPSRLYPSVRLSPNVPTFQPTSMHATSAVLSRKPASLVVA